jgi:hypothetical protein
MHWGAGGPTSGGGGGVQNSSAAPQELGGSCGRHDVMTPSSSFTLAIRRMYVVPRYQVTWLLTCLPRHRENATTCTSQNPITSAHAGRRSSLFSTFPAKSRNPGVTLVGHMIPEHVGGKSGYRGCYTYFSTQNTRKAYLDAHGRQTPRMELHAVVSGRGVYMYRAVMVTRLPW